MKCNNFLDTCKKFKIEMQHYLVDFSHKEEDKKLQFYFIFVKLGMRELPSLVGAGAGARERDCASITAGEKIAKTRVWIAKTSEAALKNAIFISHSHLGTFL